MSKHKDDGKKVKLKNVKCCSNMTGYLTRIDIQAYVDFNEAKCPEGHIGIFLEYPFEDYYEVIK